MVNSTPYDAEGKLKAGLYRGLSMLDYQKIPAINWSKVEPYLRSAAHGKAAEMRAEDSDALTVGQAVHRAVLEPALFDTEFGTIPDDAPQKRSNADKAWWAQFYADNAGRTMLKPETLRSVKLMSQAVYDRPRASAMLTAEGNTREVVAVWMHPEFGVWCKGRIDLLTRWQGGTYIADLKTARDASPWAFSRDIKTFNYHGQAAFYKDGLNTIAPFDRKWAWIVVEKEPAVAVVYDCGEATMELGQREARRAMQTYIDAEAAQKWPGYPDGEIDVPAWALKGGGE